MKPDTTKKASPIELKNEAAASRARVDTTLDRLTKKLSPDTYVKSAAEEVNGLITGLSVDEISTSIAGVARSTKRAMGKHPVPFLLGAGLVATATIVAHLQSRSERRRIAMRKALPSPEDSQGEKE